MIAVHLSFEFSNNILCFLKLSRKLFISVFKSTDLFFQGPRSDDQVVLKRHAKGDGIVPCPLPVFDFQNGDDG